MMKIIVAIVIIIIVIWIYIESHSGGIKNTPDTDNVIDRLTARAENKQTLKKIFEPMANIDRNYQVADYDNQNKYNDLATQDADRTADPSLLFYDLHKGLPVINSGNAPDEVFKIPKNYPSFEQMEKDRIRNKINENLYWDLTFGDVITYDNDPFGRSGLDRCLDNKVGTCVPYGNDTGIAYYYPPLYNEKNYGELLTDALSPQERAEPGVGGIAFPNLR